MTASQMTKNKMVRFINYVKDQGVVVVRTKKGLLCRFPDGSTEMIHFTPSDHRAKDNEIAAFRRAGIMHPDDPRTLEDLPKYLEEWKDISPKTKERALEAIRSLGMPSSVTTSEIVELTNLDSITAARALFHLDYIPKRAASGKKPWKRRWAAPEHLIDSTGLFEEDQESQEEASSVEVETPESTEDVEVSEASNQEVVDGEGTGVQKESNREFIDSVDSWIVDVESVPSDLTVKQYLSALESAGLCGEIRVWRRR